MCTQARVVAAASVVAAFLFSFPRVSTAALASAPHEDIHFIAEHVPEAFQDARFTSLPWPAGDQKIGQWRGLLDAGWTNASADFLDEKASLALLGGTYRRSESTSLQVFGFFDSGKVGGGTGEQILRASFLGSTTLDLPERARFSNPRGSLRHAGVGANWTRKTSDRWALQAGLLVNRLEARDYQLDFEILGGRNAGLRGTLDHSSTATFATPYFGGQRSWNLTLGWSLRARASAGVPLPAGEFAGRIRSASFSGSSADAQGKPGRIGDGFVALGVAFLHRPSGLEFDLGGTAFFTVFEKTTHAGIDDALLLHVTWHWK